MRGVTFFNGNMLTIQQREEKGNQMASAPIPKHSFSCPGCNGRKLPTHGFRLTGYPRRVGVVDGPVSTVRNAPFLLRWFYDFCVPIILSTFIINSSGQSTKTGFTSSGVTFESLLEHPPVIADVIFEKEMFPESVPEAARKQVFEVKLDGDNYFLSAFAGDMPSDTYGGRFGGVRWEVHGGYLTKSDPELNQLGSPLDGVEWVTRMTANMVINMGLFELIPGSAIWDAAQHRVVGRMSDGRQILAQFTYVAGLPTQCTIKEGTAGHSIGSITYQYRPDFHGGRLPIEFTRSADADAKYEQSKLFTIRIRKLEFSTGPIPADIMNPVSALGQKLKGVAMYSNSVLYLVGDSGKITRAQTAEEVNEQVAKMQGTRWSRASLFARLCVFAVLFGIPALCTLWCLMKNKNKVNSQKQILQ